MKLTPKLFYSYLAFLVVYAALTLIPAPQVAVLKQYNISATTLRLLDATIIIILAFIWYAGFLGYSKLNSYTNLIRKDKDGKQVAKLTKGVFFLVMWLPVTSVISALLRAITVKDVDAQATITIFNNYINLLIPLVGFVYIGYGARGLSSFIRQRASYKVIQLIMISLIYIGLIYLHLIAATPHRDEVYHMSFWLLTLTLVAPYVYMWSIGLFSAYEIYRYQQKVAGIIYKRSWTLLAIGISWLIVTSVCFQYLTTLTPHLQHLSLYALIAVVYALLLVLSVGFVLIAAGARKLQKIEEV